MSPEERIAELEALVTQLREQLRVLLAENQKQAAKDSHNRHNRHNRHKPPSSDGLQRRLAAAAPEPTAEERVEERVEDGRPARASGPDPALGRHARRGGHSSPASSANSVRHRWRAWRRTRWSADNCSIWLDLPPVRLHVIEQHVIEQHVIEQHVIEQHVIEQHVIEHQAAHVRCAACGHLNVASTVAAFPAEVPSRIQYGPRLRALVVYPGGLSWWSIWSSSNSCSFWPYARVRDLLADVLVRLLASPFRSGPW